MDVYFEEAHNLELSLPLPEAALEFPLQGAGLSKGSMEGHFARAAGPHLHVYFCVRPCLCMYMLFGAVSHLPGLFVLSLSVLLSQMYTPAAVVMRGGRTSVFTASGVAPTTANSRDTTHRSTALRLCPLLLIRVNVCVLIRMHSWVFMNRYLKIKANVG